MTPQEINEYALQQWNSVGDAFFSEAEMLRHVYAAQMELATKTNCIRKIFTGSTVADQQEYAKPNNAIKIKRITYEGTPLIKITDRASLSATISSGTPTYYFEWGGSIFLDPMPSAVGTLKIFCFNQPQVVTPLSTMEVPERYHLDIADYLLWKLAIKDKNFEAAREFSAIWQVHLKEAKDFERLALRGDSFSSTQYEDVLPFTTIGTL
jgi:hypothetical protein